MAEERKIEETIVIRPDMTGVDALAKKIDELTAKFGRLRDAAVESTKAQESSSQAAARQTAARLSVPEEKRERLRALESERRQALDSIKAQEAARARAAQAAIREVERVVAAQNRAAQAAIRDAERVAAAQIRAAERVASAQALATRRTAFEPLGNLAKGVSSAARAQYNAGIRAEIEAARAAEREAAEAAASRRNFVIGAGRTALGVAAGAIGFSGLSAAAAAAKDTFLINAQLEQSRLAIASTLQVSGQFTDALGKPLPYARQIAVALNEGDRALKTLREDALRLNVPIQSLAEGFGLADAAARRAGFTGKEAIRVTEGLTVLAQQLRIPPNILARDLDNILSGNRVGATQIGIALGLSEKGVKQQINAGTFRQELLHKLDPVLKIQEDLGGNTLDGITAKISNLFRELAIGAGSGVFGELKGGARDFAGYLKAINESGDIDKINRGLGATASVMRSIVGFGGQTASGLALLANDAERLHAALSKGDVVRVLALLATGNIDQASSFVEKKLGEQELARRAGIGREVHTALNRAQAISGLLARHPEFGSRPEILKAEEGIDDTFARAKRAGITPSPDIVGRYTRMREREAKYATRSATNEESLQKAILDEPQDRVKLAEVELRRAMAAGRGDAAKAAAARLRDAELAADKFKVEKELPGVPGAAGYGDVLKARARKLGLNRSQFEEEYQANLERIGKKASDGSDRLHSLETQNAAAYRAYADAEFTSRKGRNAASIKVLEAQLSILVQEKAPLEDQLRLREAIASKQREGLAMEQSAAVSARDAAIATEQRAQARLDAATTQEGWFKANIALEGAQTKRLQAEDRIAEIQDRQTAAMYEQAKAAEKIRSEYALVEGILGTLLGQGSVEGYLNKQLQTAIPQLSRKIGGWIGGNGGGSAPSNTSGAGGDTIQQAQALYRGYQGYQSGGWKGALDAYNGNGVTTGPTYTGGANPQWGTSGTGATIVNNGTGIDTGGGYGMSAEGGFGSLEGGGVGVGSPGGGSLQPVQGGATGTGAGAGGIGAGGWVAAAFAVAKLINDGFSYAKNARRAIEEAKNRPGVRQSDLVDARMNGIPIIGSYLATGNALTNNLMGRKLGAQTNERLLMGGALGIFGLLGPELGLHIFQVPQGESQLSRQIKKYADSIGMENITGGVRGVNTRGDFIAVPAALRAQRGDAELAGTLFGGLFKNTELPEKDLISGRVANYLLQSAAARHLSAEDTRTSVINKFIQPLLGNDLDDALSKAVTNRYRDRGGARTDDKTLIATAGKALEIFMDMPPAINSARLALELMDKDGTIRIEHLKRVATATKETLTVGLTDSFTALVDNPAITTTARVMGSKFSAELATSVSDGLLRDPKIAKALTAASADFVSGGELIAAGKLGEGQRLLAKARAEERAGVADYNKAAIPAALAVRLNNFALNVPGSGIENQTAFGYPVLSFDTPTIAFVPGYRGQPVPALNHGGEVVRAPAQEDKVLSVLLEVRDALRNGQEIHITYHDQTEHVLKIGYDELARAQANGERLQRVGVSTPNGMLGVRPR